MSPFSIWLYNLLDLSSQSLVSTLTTQPILVNAKIITDESAEKRKSSQVPRLERAE